MVQFSLPVLAASLLVVKALAVPTPQDSAVPTPQDPAVPTPQDPAQPVPSTPSDPLDNIVPLNSVGILPVDTLPANNTLPVEEWKPRMEYVQDLENNFFGVLVGVAMPANLHYETDTCNGTVAECLPECALETDKPETWAQSGASALLDKWFAENSTDDWLRNMEKAYSSDGTETSAIDCSSTSSRDCVGPQDLCSEYNPSSYYYMFKLCSLVPQSC